MVAAVDPPATTRTAVEVVAVDVVTEAVDTTTINLTLIARL